MTADKRLNLYTATVQELYELLNSGQHTSVELVKLYLLQIEKHNHAGLNLHAVIATAPLADVIAEAMRLDDERAQGKLRSHAHGIPIIVKDNSCTGSLGMPTTSGTLGLSGLECTVDAAYITLLRQAGFIIIAKANLSELGNMKGTNIKSGWSPVGGQTQSPYVRGGVIATERWLGHSTPGGSSSGSAVSVAAGFAPCSIGTETDGSVVWPATRAALYSLKATIGAVDMAGMQADGNTFISPGGLTKCVADLALITSILVSRPSLSTLPPPSWASIRLAVVDPELWKFSPDYCEPLDAFFSQTGKELDLTMRKVEELGAKVFRNAPMKTPEDCFKDLGWKGPGALAVHQARPCMERYFKLFSPPRLQNLEDLIRFNEEHAEQELPPENSNQDYLRKAVADKMTKEQFEKDMNTYQSKMRAEVVECLTRSDADIIVAPGDSNLTVIGMGSGYPIASVPLGFADFNGRPFSLLFLAKVGEERKLLEAMSAWEATFPERRRPPPLMEAWEKEKSSKRPFSLSLTYREY